MYSVNFWGSDPDAGNDDCHNGKEFDTREAAETAYEAMQAGMAGGCQAYNEVMGYD